MTVDLSTIQYAIAKVGRTATLRRLVAGGPNVDVTVKVYLTMVAENEVVGGIFSDKRRGYLSNSEIAAAAWPGPPQRGDVLIVAGQEGMLGEVETRNVAGADALHIFDVAGV